MAGSQLQDAYDRALAVMTAPCRFVEWKAYGGALRPHDFHPIGFEDDTTNAWREIPGERWIYVYRRGNRFPDDTRWVEEIHLSAEEAAGGAPTGSREMASVPAPTAQQAGQARPDPRPIGKTISFARRIAGVSMEYFFLASRVRLTPELAIEFAAEVGVNVHPVTFEPSDTSIVGGRGDVLLVTVLDPLTVAQHLHAYFKASHDDYLHYQLTDPTMDAPTAAPIIRRLKKVALANLINALRRSDKSGSLEGWLANDGGDLQEFLTGYADELEARRAWRAEWGLLLTRWLESPPMRLMQRAHAVDAEKDFASFLLTYCMCLTGMSSLDLGRAFLARTVEDKTHFVHTYVLPKTELSEPVHQTVRKTHSAVLSAILEYVPGSLLKDSALQLEHIVDGVRFITRHEYVYRKGTDAFRLIVEPLPQGWLSPAFVAAQKEGKPLIPSWPGALTSVAALIEVINLGFAIRTFRDAWGQSPLDVVLASANLVGSALDLTTAGAQLFRLNPATAVFMGEALGITEVTLTKISILSAAVDVALAAVDTIKAVQQGDTRGAEVAGIVTIGSLDGLIAGLMILRNIPGGAIVGLLGLAIVAIGRGLSIFTGSGPSPDDSPYFQLLNYSEWGLHAAGNADRGNFSPAPFKDWPGNLDLQISAAVNLLCSFSLGKNIVLDGPNGEAVFGELREGLLRDLREARLVGTWFPPGSVLHVIFQETWEDSRRNRKAIADFKVGQNGLEPEEGAELSIRPDGGEGRYVLRPIPSPGELPAIVKHGPDFAPGLAWSIAPGLQQITIYARLHIPVGNMRYLVPYKDPDPFKLV